MLRALEQRDCPDDRATGFVHQTFFSDEMVVSPMGLFIVKSCLQLWNVTSSIVDDAQRCIAGATPRGPTRPRSGLASRKLMPVLCAIASHLLAAVRRHHCTATASHQRHPCERPPRPRKQFSTAKQPSRGRLQTLHDGIRNPTAKRRGRPPKTRPATGGASSVVFGDELSQAFEKEMETDADANSRLMLMPESQLKRSGNNPLQSEDDSIIHPNFAAVLNVAKPAAQLDAHSVSSTTK